MEMTLEVFSTISGHPAVQRHRLAMRPRNLEQAVRVRNEYMQIQAYQRPPQPGVTPVYDDEASEEEKDPAVSVAQGDSSAEIELLPKAIEEIGKAVHRIEWRQRHEAEDQCATNPWCYGCGRIGHLRQDFPRKEYPRSMPRPGLHQHSHL